MGASEKSYSLDLTPDDVNLKEALRGRCFPCGDEVEAVAAHQWLHTRVRTCLWVKL